MAKMKNMKNTKTWQRFAATRIHIHQYWAYKSLQPLGKLFGTNVNVHNSIIYIPNKNSYVCSPKDMH